jgi:hypothetical protein
MDSEEAILVLNVLPRHPTVPYHDFQVIPCHGRMATACFFLVFHAPGGIALVISFLDHWTILSGSTGGRGSAMARTWEARNGGEEITHATLPTASAKTSMRLGEFGVGQRPVVTAGLDKSQ